MPWIGICMMVVGAIYLFERTKPATTEDVGGLLFAVGALFAIVGKLMERESNG